MRVKIKVNPLKCECGHFSQDHYKAFGGGGGCDNCECKGMCPKTLLHDTGEKE